MMRKRPRRLVRKTVCLFKGHDMKVSRNYGSYVSSYCSRCGKLHYEYVTVGGASTIELWEGFIDKEFKKSKIWYDSLSRMQKIKVIVVERLREFKDWLTY